MSPTRRISARPRQLLTITAIVAAALGGTSASQASASAGENYLTGQQKLASGQQLVTSNGISLIMQTDGNLVEYAPGNRAVWATNTFRAGSELWMQGDGNPVVVAPGGAPMWAAGTSGNPGASLELQTDGNLVVYGTGHLAKWANGVSLSGGSSTSKNLARDILGMPSIALATVHVSGVKDAAHARQNVTDVANGLGAARSSYGTAPGGRVAIDPRVLSTIKDIGSRHRIRVSEIAGGSHSSGSKHYSGRALDIDMYDGSPVKSSTNQWIVGRCRAFGSTYSLLENGNHFHCQW